MTGLVVFLGAFLLFCVELLVGKVALPRFGGSPAVWTTSLFFFQLALLGGYTWAQRLAAATAQRQKRLHLGLLGLASAVLLAQAVLWPAPLVPPASTAGSGPMLEMARLLLLSVGLPFLALSATAPLVQVWAARSGHAAPWRLYALSNAGALCALVAYPLVIEPRLGLRAQAWGWTALFLLDAAALAVVALRSAASPAEAPEGAPATRLSPRDVAAWMGLAALGTLQLGATSNVLCQDVSAGPLLWALPLGIYLLSFILPFEHPRWDKPALALGLFTVGAGMNTGALVDGDYPLWRLIAAHLLLQLGSSLFVHGTLYRRRPGAEQLGSYYLALSAGGALGSLAVSLGGPLLLDDYWEFPAGVVVVALLGLFHLARRPDDMKAPLFVARLALAISLLLLVLTLALTWVDERKQEHARLRNFFGVLHVVEKGEGTKDHRVSLFHGNIIHGLQMRVAGEEHEPRSYYARTSGLGEAVRLLHEKRSGLDAAVLGLGVGTSAALFNAGDAITFYEIDSNVIRLARGEGGYFDYLRTSPANVTVREGDARAVLERDLAEGRGQRDLVAVDVFSGDAIPVHLFTAEALSLYARALKPDGVLALHVSNRHLELTRVAFPLLKQLGLPAVKVVSARSGWTYQAAWVIASHDEALLDALAKRPWELVERETDEPHPWTDDRSSLMDVWR